MLSLSTLADERIISWLPLLPRYPAWDEALRRLSSIVGPFTLEKKSSDILRVIVLTTANRASSINTVMRTLVKISSSSSSSSTTSSSSTGKKIYF
jgi:hypothetical protein